MTTDKNIEPSSAVSYFEQFHDFSLRNGELPKNAFKRLAKLRQWSEKRKGREQRKLDKCIADESTEELNSSLSNMSLNGNHTATTTEEHNQEPDAPRKASSYFSQFPDFSLRKGETDRNAFKRLARANGWSDNKRDSERIKFHTTIARELVTKIDSLQFLQDLCVELFHPEHVPTTITQCKKLLKSKYVNIWDVYEENYRYFDKYKDFRSYTSNGRIFKKQAAKALNLNVFLRGL